MIVLVTQFTIEIFASGKVKECSRVDLFQYMLPHVLEDLLYHISLYQKDPHLPLGSKLFSEFRTTTAKASDDPSNKYVFYEKDSDEINYVPCQRYWRNDFDIVLQAHLHYVLWLASDLPMKIKRSAFSQQFGKVQAKRAKQTESNLHQEPVMSSLLVEMDLRASNLYSMPYLAREIYPIVYSKTVTGTKGVHRTEQQMKIMDTYSSKENFGSLCSFPSWWSIDSLPSELFDYGNEDTNDENSKTTNGDVIAENIYEIVESRQGNARKSVSEILFYR